MLAFDRHQEILDLLEKNQSMSVKALSDALYASEATVRRDLVTLEKQGYINRIFGGAVLAKYANMHLPISARQQESKIAKAQIAAAAVEKITDGSIIMMDGSTSCHMMLPHLKQFQKLTIISNSLDICKESLEMGHTVYNIGGCLEAHDQIGVGYYAEKMLKMMHADMIFFSCSGLSFQGEMTGVYEQGISYLNAALKRANRRYFLCDSTKIGKTFQHRLAVVEDVDEVLCEKPLPKELMERVGKNRPYSLVQNTDEVKNGHD